MFEFIKKSFKTKRILIAIISIFLLGIGISLMILKFEYDSQLEEMKIDGFNIAKVTAKNIESISAGDADEGVKKLVENSGTSNGIKYMALIDINMVDVIDSQKQDIGKSFADDDATIETVIYKKDSPSFYVDPTGAIVLDIQVPVDFKVGGNKIAAVDIGVPMDNLYKNTCDLIKNSFSLIIELIKAAF